MSWLCLLDFLASYTSGCGATQLFWRSNSTTVFPRLCWAVKTIHLDLVLAPLTEQQCPTMGMREGGLKLDLKDQSPTAWLPLGIYSISRWGKVTKALPPLGTLSIQEAESPSREHWLGRWSTWFPPQRPNERRGRRLALRFVCDSYVLPYSKSNTWKRLWLLHLSKSSEVYSQKAQGYEYTVHTPWIFRNI